MKRYRWWLGSLLVAVFALAPALAAIAGEPGGEPKRKKREGKRPKREKGPREKGPRKRAPKGLFEQVTAVCTLTDEQKAKFKEACDKYEEAKKATTKEMGEIRKQMAEARKAKDKAKAKELGAKMKDLSKEANDAMAAALACLTPEQRIAWDAQQLSDMITGRLKKAELTQDQKNQILALCKKKVEALKDADEKTKRRAAGETFKEVYESILTADQKTNIKAPPERKGKKDKPPREKKDRKRKKKEE